MILKITLHKKLSLHSHVCLGFFTLEISNKKVSLSLHKSSPLFNTPRNTLDMSTRTMSHNLQCNRSSDPSSLEAIVDFICFKAAYLSSILVKSASKVSLTSSFEI